MKNSALFFALALFLLFPKLVQAEINVSISNNLDGSKNSVKVNSNTSVHQSNSSSSKTDIVIEANGEKKEYHSSSGEDVKLESSDGTSKVEINNNSQPTSSPTPNSSPNTNTSVSVNVNGVKIQTSTSSPSPSPTPQTTIQVNQIDKDPDLRFNFISFVQAEMDELNDLLNRHFNFVVKASW